MELVLNTFGVTLSRDNEGFVIVTAEGKQRIPAEGITSIQMSRGAQISSDAVLLAMEKEIEVLFVDKAGAVIGRIWSPKYGSISTIRKGQLAFSFSKDALEWIKEVLRQKIENQQALLLMFRSDNEAQNESVAKSIAKMEDHREKLGKLDGDIVADVAAQLRGWEGKLLKSILIH